MRFEINDRYFNVFFVEIQLKKKNFGRQSLGAQTGIPVSQTTSIRQ